MFPLRILIYFKKFRSAHFVPCSIPWKCKSLQMSADKAGALPCENLSGCILYSKQRGIWLQYLWRLYITSSRSKNWVPKFHFYFKRLDAQFHFIYHPMLSLIQTRWHELAWPCWNHFLISPWTEIDSCLIILWDISWFFFWSDSVHFSQSAVQANCKIAFICLWINYFFKDVCATGAHLSMPAFTLLCWPWPI